MTPDAARTRFGSARIARLATVRPDGSPHLVPIVFALSGDTIYSAVDRKPKRSNNLVRLDNAAHNPAVCVLVDHYDDADWDRLWWVRADGQARILASGDGESALALGLLADRYPQHQVDPPPGPVLAVDVDRWQGWISRP